MSVIKELAKIGQSVWLDNISRKLIDSGSLRQMIDLGLLGETSNPTIFGKAVVGSNDYAGIIKQFAGKSAFEIYDALTVKDVQDAADIFADVYKTTKGMDGYVSLEVNPHLAAKTDETIAEAKRLWRKVDRPNLMIKVPATLEGLPAVKALIADGLNINVTLIFSCQQYRDVAHAFIEGSTEYGKKGGDLAKVASVASVFVSRVDTLTDKLIDESGKKGLERFKGKAAVANAKMIYQEYLNIFEKAKQIPRPQRVLWASTGTKNKAYSDIKYVEELIGKDTVNTMPDNTWQALLDHGQAKESILSGVAQAKNDLEDLKAGGIGIDQVCAKLMADGVVAFERSFDELLKTIEREVLV
jgi:transaldolase